MKETLMMMDGNMNGWVMYRLMDEIINKSMLDG